MLGQRVSALTAIAPLRRLCDVPGMNRAVWARVLSVLLVAAVAITFSVQSACSSGGSGGLGGYGYGQ